jgi:hypothetical protein
VADGETEEVIDGAENDGCPFQVTVIAQHVATYQDNNHCELVSRNVSGVWHIIGMPGIRIVMKIAKPADRKALEEALQTKFRVPIIDDAIDKAIAQGVKQGIEQGIEQGLKQGEVDIVLVILEERFTVSADTRVRVEKCGSLERLKDWARRAMTAQSLEDVFAEA